jgi:uracil-DNA glycosylase family 4
LAREQASAAMKDQTGWSRASLEAALGWWSEAGVDSTFHDQPTDWLAAARENKATQAQATAPAPITQPEPPRRPIDARERMATSDTIAPIGGNPAHWPQKLEDFASWWLTEASLGPAPAAARVPPTGPAGAQLMVLVPMPEPGDSQVLLTGREGKLLDTILAAMGLARTEIYLASALPAALAMPDWQALRDAGLGDVVMHQIALAMPQRLLVFGKTDISSLITHDPANNAAILRVVNQERASVPLALDFALATLLAQPSLKRRVWMNWLEWTEAGLQ